MRSFAWLSSSQSIVCQFKFFTMSNGTDTEIDWKAYMEQVEQFLQGERDYALIKGATGPLWYVFLGGMN